MKLLTCLCTAAGVTLICGLMCGAARAEQLHVPGEFPYIKAAMNAAQDGDEVVVAPGTYMGFNNRDLDFLGKSITVRSVAPDDPAVVAATVINCQQEGRAFILQSGETLDSVIAGLTVINGFALDGAGVYLINASSVTIRNCVFTGNIVPVQSGIIDSADVDFDLHQLVIEACTIAGNEGSAINVQDLELLEVTSSTIEDNTAMGIRRGSYPTVAIVVRDCTISGNGGGGFWGGQGGSVEVAGCTVTDNGGMGGLGLTGAVVVVENCTISGNDAAQQSVGGLAVHADTTGVVRNCLIADNTGISAGGLLLSGFGAIDIIGCTVVGNVATEYGGGGILAFGTDPTTITNTILWGNTGPMAPQLHLDSGFNSPAKVALDFSVLEGGPKQVFVDDKGGCCATSELIYGASNIVSDPLFADPDAGDYQLTADSPCVEAGDPAFIAGEGETDLDGDPRVVAEVVDMGSDEFRKPADLNADGVVDVIDLVALVLEWGPCPELPVPPVPPAPAADCPADINGDGGVDVLDLVELVLSWG